MKGSVKTKNSSVKSSVKSETGSVKFNHSSLNNSQKKILRMIEQDTSVSAAKMAEEIGISLRAVEKNIKELRDQSILIRHGAARGGYWEITGEKNKLVTYRTVT